MKILEEVGNRFTNEYMRTAIDWLELHNRVMCMQNGFLVTSWTRLEYGDVKFRGGIKSIYAGHVVSDRVDVVVFMANVKNKDDI